MQSVRALTDRSSSPAGNAKRREIRIEFDEEASKWIAEKGYDPVYGARPLKRFLQKQVETRLARGILSGEVTDQSMVRFALKDEELVYYNV